MCGRLRSRAWVSSVKDKFPLATGFVISCPVSDVGGSPVREIRKRGNIPLVLQEDVVVELTRSDMLESWASACKMGREKARGLMKSAADRIAGALEDLVRETAESRDFGLEGESVVHAIRVERLKPEGEHYLEHS